MGITIEEIIENLTTIRNKLCSRKYETESTLTFDVAIDTMRKYQKIEQIYSDYLKYMNPDNLADRIGEVLEDRNDE